MASIKPIRKKWRDRDSYWIDNGLLRAMVLTGGGHIASLTLRAEGPTRDLNPLWVPQWPSLEPKNYQAERDDSLYGGMPEGRLLASIMGHNPCLDFFGTPSETELAAGIGVHGEAPVQSWNMTGTGTPADGPCLDCRTFLRNAQMFAHRRITIRPGSLVLTVETTLENITDAPRPFGWQEHVSFGAPFLEKGVTLLDMNATWGQVSPREFSRKMRLVPGSEITWPQADGMSGTKLDLRAFPDDEYSGDFSAHLIDPSAEWGWFTMVNPKQHLLVGYLWKRSDFPWVGNWEENLSREHAPWAGREIARGIEFGLSPFPFGREEMLRMKELHGVPVLGELPPREKKTAVFHIFMTPVPDDCSGVSAVAITDKDVTLTLKDDQTIVLPIS